MNQTETQHFDQILKYLQQTRGFDFSAYKRPSLMRRIRRRMQAVGIGTFEEYFDHLQVHQEESAALFNTILINVTSFFRDPEAWEYVRQSVLPQILAARAETPIRLWSAGAASGQEAYTVVMLLAELLGPDGVRERVKVYATDVDEDALAEARGGVYSARAVEHVPPDLRHKYFEPSGGSFAFSPALRRSVIFGRHDLVQDAPISHIDFLMCRNTIMYFNAEAQGRVLARFYFSLNPDAFILFGRAEMLFSHTAIFTPVDFKRRVFRAVPTPNHRDRLLLLAQTGRDVMPNELPHDGRLREASFELDASPTLVVDDTGALAAANTAARQRFSLLARDVGRPLAELAISHRPASELGIAVSRALQEREEVVLEDIEHLSGAEARALDIWVSPLVEDDRLIGARVEFRDVTEVKMLARELAHSKHELETAYEELQSTNEELETTNEELQSTVEELETTNEELQSTNEDLETMNEELQSTNEELQTINDALRNRSTDLNAANSFLQSVFASLRSAVVVLDGDFRVQVWNDRSTDLWGLREDEAQGANFLDLDIGLPLGELRQPIREVLTGRRMFDDRVVTATNRRGRSFECRVGIGHLRHFDDNGDGVILLMDEHQASQTPQIT